jgi:hypothetical protein
MKRKLGVFSFWELVQSSAVRSLFSACGGGMSGGQRGPYDPYENDPPNTRLMRVLVYVRCYLSRGRTAEFVMLSQQRENGRGVRDDGQ